jgi:double-stranded uracil-DNA glycosylase
VNTVQQFQPKVLAILGISAYRAAFNRPKTQMGEQPEGVGPARLWILPNPSGLNAHYTPADLARVFRDFRLTIEG